MKNYLFFLGFILIICSCDSKRVFEENKAIPNSKWNRNNIITFNVNVTDVNLRNNVYLNIRHNGLYSNRNIYLFIDIVSPNGKQIRDTVNCILADEKGKWLGSGLGDIYNNQLLYKSNVSFPNKGNYKFKIEQAMRTETLENIEDIGVRIEKTN